LILFNPTNLALDPAGDIFICDPVTNSIRRLAPGGALSLFAGSGQINGFNDGTGTGARFNYPTGIATDGNGNVYVVDSLSGLVRRITPAGVVSTLAGSPFIDGRADGAGAASGFDAPYGITATATGDIYITDGASIRKGRVAAAPVITTQPQNQVVTSGGSVTFSVAASGAPDPTYQWHFNGTPFAGATGSSLTFSNARSTDAGSYSVTATNSQGAVTSNSVTLTVNSVSNPPPASGGGGGGGGGVPSVWFIFGVILLGLVRRVQGR
jgi:Immunoglobulin domain